MTPAENVPVALPLRQLALEITGKCNLTCSHCYAESGPRLSLRGEMATADWLRLIDEAAELGCRDLSFIGGEPTLHPDLPAMIERAAGRGFERIEVFTNATRLRPALLATLQHHGVRLAASFYSADPAVHEAITGVKGSWRQTVAGLEAALAAGLEVRIGVVEMAENAGQAAETLAFLRSLGVAEIRVDRLRGVGRGSGPAQDAGGEGAENYSALCGQCWKGKLCVTSSGATFPCELARRTNVGQAKLGLGRLLGERKLAEFRAVMKELGQLAAGKGSPGDDLQDWPGGGGCGPAKESIQPCNPDDNPDVWPGGGGCGPVVAPCGPDGGLLPDPPDPTCGPQPAARGARRAGFAGGGA